MKIEKKLFQSNTKKKKDFSLFTSFFLFFLLRHRFGTFSNDYCNMKKNSIALLYNCNRIMVKQIQSVSIPYMNSMIVSYERLKQLRIVR